ncbi:hypothetical protein LY76DRAFT_596197 [Colletotrichum caudatum]|nr:hypothetical protein LY76DRAFT_596197 [Colletotrichum caudatum]
MVCRSVCCSLTGPPWVVGAYIWLQTQRVRVEEPFGASQAKRTRASTSRLTLVRTPSASSASGFPSEAGAQMVGYAHVSAATLNLVGEARKVLTPMSTLQPEEPGIMARPGLLVGHRSRRE